MLDSMTALGFPDRQWVCVVCGYNMIGDRPDVCPFCGARHYQFVDWEACEKGWRVTSQPVAEGVSRLQSVPRLGIEHAAWRIETGDGPVWIDCPSAFNRTLEAAGHIYFSHCDFMGASNQYRALWQAKVHIHAAEMESPLAAPFPVDDAFDGDFTAHGIAAFHIGGHTPGWTAYAWGGVLFACDYAFPPGKAMALNPYGDRRATVAGARRLLEVARGLRPRLVAGYNYACDGGRWIADFEGALARAAA